MSRVIARASDVDVEPIHDTGFDRSARVSASLFASAMMLSEPSANFNSQRAGQASDMNASTRGFSTAD
ncbi:hypothetical protein [Dokdonella sp.]|uniref:hypothetical protein n=1 Tax=Dokdonella sp. TaxID=2291710 RepID=UPI003C5A22CD